MAQDPQDPPRTIDELRSHTFGFDEHPLEHFRGLSAEEIEAHSGIGPKYRQRIQEELAELDGLLRAAGEKVPAPAHPQPAAAEALQPIDAGSGGTVVMLLVILIVCIIAVTVYFGGSHGMSEETKRQLEALQEQLDSQGLAISSVSDDALTDVEQVAVRVYAKTQEGNFGEAREHLGQVDGQLRALETLAAQNGLGITGGRSDLLPAARAAYNKAHTALQLTAPHTQEELEGAVKAMVEAIAALRGEEVKQ